MLKHISDLITQCHILAGLLLRQHNDIRISLEVLIWNHTVLLRIQKEGQLLLMANPDVWKPSKTTQVWTSRHPSGLSVWMVYPGLHHCASSVLSPSALRRQHSNVNDSYYYHHQSLEKNWSVSINKILWRDQKLRSVRRQANRLSWKLWSAWYARDYSGALRGVQ